MEDREEKGIVEQSSIQLADVASGAAPHQERSKLRRRPGIITVTPAAQDRVAALVATAGDGVIGLRIGVKARGCTGLSYVFEHATEEAVGAGDEVVELDNGRRVIIEAKACLYLIGSQLDYVDETVASRFVFNNPNAKAQCGCGESFYV